MSLHCIYHKKFAERELNNNNDISNILITKKTDVCLFSIKE